MATVKIKGIKEVRANLNRQIKLIEGSTLAGGLEAAAFLYDNMEKVPPTIPKDTGNLRSSWSVTSVTRGKRWKVIMSFTANYAALVHEKVDSNVQWKTEGSGPKFFEAGIQRNTKIILEIIRRNAKVK